MEYEKILRQAADKIKIDRTVPMVNNDMNLINESRYELNKSGTKYVCVGLSPQILFTPAVKICGNKSRGVIFNRNEWCALVENQGIITNYFYSVDSPWVPMKIGSKTIYFETINKTKVIRVVDFLDVEIYLGWESLEQLWKILNIVAYRIICLAELNFNSFYNNVVNVVVDMVGDVKENINQIIIPLQDVYDEKVSCMMEVVEFAANKLYGDIEHAKNFGSSSK
ncbi:hypothetical protein PPYR_11270 [Photinus pyralis]|uniref:Uncharacterized protein n=1 Tax=Photinus pyralis TaxID=7054 RepID=A0A5N4A5J6_PHOPY|nr:hypothetical protein PPYR_14573 [Photinus pyralis]KAB0794431.1 hypothetical protein PPYR_11270 [Photinus pyralis]